VPVLFGSPTNADLSIIENVFGILKARARALPCAHMYCFWFAALNRESLVERLHVEIGALEAGAIFRTYLHALTFLEPGICGIGAVAGNGSEAHEPSRPTEGKRSWKEAQLQSPTERRSVVNRKPG